MSQVPLLRISLFGGFALHWGNFALPAIPGRAARSLFAYLVTYRHQPHTRDLLAGTFWPELPDARARRRLSQALWRLGRVLNPLPSPVPVILTEANTLQFNTNTPYWLDIEAFEKELQELKGTQRSLPPSSPSSSSSPTTPSLASLQRAVDLYRGDFMAGFHDDWLTIERERLRDLYLAALDRLVRLNKAAGAYEEALGYARRLIAEDPLREVGHREVMRLCHLLGHVTKALQQYEYCREVLAAELGTEPTATTTALYQEIAVQAEAGEAPYLPLASRQRPSPLLEGTGQVPLVGRERERETLLSWLEEALDSRSGLVLVEGEAGVGKTRLLQEIARDAEWRGVRVVWGRGRELTDLPPYALFVEALRATLSPLRAEQLSQLVEGSWLRVASRLIPELAEWLPQLPPDVTLGAEQERVRLLEALTRIVLALGQISPHLLILEDLQWADEASREAFSYLAGRLAGRRVLLVGSYRSGEARAQAGLWAWLRLLDRTAGCRRLEISSLTLTDTGELVQRGLGLNAVTPRFAARLYRETAGNPLFVLETLRALHDEGLLYQDESGAWSTPWDAETTDYAELPLPMEVYQVIVRRLQRLGPDEQAVLSMAAVLGADFELALLLQAVDLERKRCLAAVGKLVRRRLLEEGPTKLRFSHDKVRQAVYQEMGEQERRLLHQRAGEALESWHSEQAESLAYHFTEAQVWDKAAVYNRQAGDRAKAVYAGMEATGYYSRVLEIYEQRREVDEGTAIELYQTRGEVCQETGHFDQAEADFQAACMLARRLRDREAEARATNCLSYLHFQRGNFKPAIESARQALNVSQGVGSAVQMASALLNMANALRNSGDSRRALRVYQQAAALFEQLDDPRRLADCLNRMGYAYLFQGCYNEARDVIERSLAARWRLNDKVGLSYSLTNLTALCYFQGQFYRAREAAQEALDIARAIGDPYGEDAALFNLGLVNLEQSSPDQAISYFEHALAIAQAIGDRPLQTETLSEMGRAYCELGDLEAARRVLEEGLRTGAAAGERWQAAKTHAYLARVFLATGDGDQALAQADAGLQTARELEDPWSLGLTNRVMGEVAAHPGSGRGAVEPGFHFEESIRILREIDAKAELARSLATYGLHLARSVDAGEARRGAALMDEARALFRRLGMAWDLTQLEAEITAHPQPGQIRVHLSAASAPTGRPLQDDEWVMVVWTVAAQEDEAIAGKVPRRRHRLLRLLREAEEQGAAPTVDGLARVLNVGKATIKRDLAALRRAGYGVHTRGSRRISGQ